MLERATTTLRAIGWLLFFGWFLVPLALGLLTRNWTVAGFVVLAWPLFWALVALLLRLTSAPNGHGR